jgi:N-acetylmuramoyl-L-alanine amidase
MKIAIEGGHGYNTPGKRSPDNSFYEWNFNREIASGIVCRLTALGYDAELTVPEQEDISLQERCNRVNKLCNLLGTENVIFLSVHANAAGNGSSWMGARGWECYTTPGNTKSDILATCLYNSAENIFQGMKIRKDMSDGDPDKEANFYVIKNTKCPAVLTENFFYDNKEDLAFLQSDEGKKKIIEVHVRGIIDYLDRIGERK